MPAGAEVTRAGALPAVGAVVGVAVLVAGGLVGWIRVSAGSADVDPSPSGLLDEEPPEELAGGFEPAPVPGAITGTVDEPVVGAVVLDALPEGATDCGLRGPVNPESEPELVWAVVTPDGLHAGLLHDEDPWMEPGVNVRQEIVVGPDVEVVEEEEEVVVPDPAQPAPPLEPVPVPPPHNGDEGWRFLETCTMEWDGGGWWSRGGGGTTVPAEGPLPVDLGTGTSCCDEGGIATATASVTPVDGADWALQDRGGYWLAFPLDGLEVVPLSWRFREPGFRGVRGPGPWTVPSVHVLFVADDGTVIEERFVGDR